MIGGSMHPEWAENRGIEENWNDICQNMPCFKPLRPIFLQITSNQLD